MDIIDRIFEMIDKNNTSAAEVSKVTGIKQATFSQWKKRLQMPSTEKIAILAKHFNVSADYLLGTEQNKTASPLRDEAVQLYNRISNLTPEQQAVIENLLAQFEKK